MATLAVEGRSNENVSLVASGSFVVAVWSASTSESTDIYSAVSVDDGVTWGVPVRVNSTPGEARAGGEQPPRITLLPPRGIHDPDVVIMWAARGEKGTRLLFASSRDGGRTYSKSEAVPGTVAPGNRGWHSLATDDLGRAIALWLDHRNAASSAPSAVHRHGEASNAPRAPEVAVEKAGLSELWSGSLDGTIPAKRITGGVCYCCKTAIATSGPMVFAVWRHVFPGNQRDIAFAMSRDGGKTFEEIRRVSEDKWQFDGCPENGPAIAVGSDDIVHVAWVTPEDGKEGAPLALYRSRSRDGITFSPRERIKTSGAAGHAQLTAGTDGAIALAWDEATSKGRRVKVTRWRNVSAFPGVVVDDSEGLYPTLATTPNGTVVAWVRRGGPKTVIAVRTMP
jgi:hypothetical protein